MNFLPLVLGFLLLKNFNIFVQKTTKVVTRIVATNNKISKTIVGLSWTVCWIG